MALFRRKPATPDLDHVNILMFNAAGRGGVARSVNILANQLASTRSVDVYSVMRDREEPQFEIDPRVRVHWLVDNRTGGGRRGRPRRDPQANPRDKELDNTVSALEPDKLMSAYTDLVLERTLPKLRPGYLITTRPLLHLAALKWAPPHQVLVAQDHGNFERRMISTRVHEILDEVVPAFDAFVTLTDSDRDDYQKMYPAANVARVPNASPYKRGHRSTLDTKIALSAGRLSGEKGFDRLIDAYAPLATEFPDWQLHIYGKGLLHDKLQDQIDRLDVAEHVKLQGYTLEFDRVLSESSFYAMASYTEGFPMVLLEAMSHGLPLVSFDCPRGPAEIIRDGVNGRLVDDGDLPAYTDALRQVIGDDALRHEMGDAAYDDAEQYEVERVAQGWEQVLASAAARHSRR